MVVGKAHPSESEGHAEGQWDSGGWNVIAEHRRTLFLHTSQLCVKRPRKVGADLRLAEI